MIYVFLAEGFEEVEALAPVDILRRGGFQVKTVGVGGKVCVGSHNISVVCDLTVDEISLDGDLLGVILPGGMPGTLNLQKSKAVNKAIDFSAKNGLLIAAICAAPLILGEKGLLKGKKATCYTGFEEKLLGALVLEQPVVKDGNIITAFGAGAALDFGFEILGYLNKDEEKTQALRKAMRYL